MDLPGRGRIEGAAERCTHGTTPGGGAQPFRSRPVPLQPPLNRAASPRSVHPGSCGSATATWIAPRRKCCWFAGGGASRAAPLAAAPLACAVRRVPPSEKSTYASASEPGVSLRQRARADLCTRRRRWATRCRAALMGPGTGTATGTGIATAARSTATGMATGMASAARTRTAATAMGAISLNTLTDALFVALFATASGRRPQCRVLDLVL